MARAASCAPRRSLAGSRAKKSVTSAHTSSGAGAVAPQPFQAGVERPPVSDARQPIGVGQAEQPLVAGAQALGPHGKLVVDLVPQLGLIVGPQPPVPELSLGDAISLRWVLPAAAGAFRRQVDALFLAADVTAPTDVIRCDSLLTTKAIVRTTRYVTILPRRVAAAELSIGVLRAIHMNDSHFVRTVGVRYLKSVRHTESADRLLAALPQLHEQSGSS